MEIFDVFEKVKNISEILNTNDENYEVDNKDNFLNILNVMQLFKSLNNTKEENQPESDTQNSEDFNFKFNTKGLSSITQVLPYLDFEYQKEVLLFAKIMEVKQLVSSYKSVVTTASLEQKESAKKGILLAIKPKLNIEKQPIVDICLKFLEMNEIVNKMKLKES